MSRILTPVKIRLKLLEIESPAFNPCIIRGFVALYYIIYIWVGTYEY